MTRLRSGVGGGGGGEVKKKNRESEKIVASDRSAGFLLFSRFVGSHEMKLVLTSAHQFALTT